MKEVLAEDMNNEDSKKKEIIRILSNQHPVMYWWFGVTSLSLCSIYLMLLTKL